MAWFAASIGGSEGGKRGDLKYRSGSRLRGCGTTDKLGGERSVSGAAWLSQKLVGAAVQVARREHPASRQRRAEAVWNRQGMAMARWYGISRSLLSIWRPEYSSGTLGALVPSGGFVPLVMESGSLPSTGPPSREVDEARIDITLTNGCKL